MFRTCYWCKKKMYACNMQRLASKSGELKWSCGNCPKHSKRPVEVVAKVKIDDILGGRWRVLARRPMDMEVQLRAG